MDLFDDDFQTESPEDGPGQEEVEGQEGSEEEEPSDAELPAKFKGDQERYEKSYQNLERAFTQSQQELTAMRQQFAYMMGAMQGGMQAGQQPAKEEVDPEAWMEQISQGPQALDQRYQQMFQQQIAQYLAPIQAQLQQSYWDRQALGLAAQYPDLGAYQEDMGRVYREFPELEGSPRGMELAYRIAKANRFFTGQNLDSMALMKQAARMPGQAARGGTEKRLSGEEALKAAIFGTRSKKGVFDE